MINQNAQLMHLYWRAGFGLSFSEWQQRKNWTRGEAIEELFKDAEQVNTITAPSLQLPKSREALTDEEKQRLRRKSNQLLSEVNTDWIARMAAPSESALLERMSLFWHGHFACESKGPRVAVGQLNAIRKHALGNFKDLVLAIAQDPAMIRYLNNQQNRKRSPNENFARELLELFTIGIGHYSEKDIKEAARAFTGWSSNAQGTFVFRVRQHDYGSKTFMGKTGDFDGSDIIDIILEQEQTAKFIVTKIYRYFVNQDLDESRIEQLAQQFYQSNYNITTLMRSIFSSDWFYEQQHIGTKIKSPIELTAGIMRALEAHSLDQRSLINIQRLLGQTLFKPPNVAGWKGGRAWIDNATLMMRLNMTAYFTNGAKVRRGRIRMNDEMMQTNQSNSEIQQVNWANFFALKSRSENEIFEELKAYFLAAYPKLASEKVLPFVDRSSEENFIKSLILRLTSLPEYQMC